jgi:hypothetical protein
MIGRSEVTGWLRGLALPDRLNLRCANLPVTTDQRDA